MATASYFFQQAERLDRAADCCRCKKCLNVQSRYDTRFDRIDKRPQRSSRLRILMTTVGARGASFEIVPLASSFLCSRRLYDRLDPDALVGRQAPSVRSASAFPCRRRDAARSRAIASSRTPDCRNFLPRSARGSGCGGRSDWVASPAAAPRDPADDCPETKTSVACRRDSRSRRHSGVPRPDPPVSAQWFLKCRVA